MIDLFFCSPVELRGHEHFWSSCEPRGHERTARSGAADHTDNAIGVATTLAHEMGHNLGLSHDAPGCVCRSSQPQSGCIKAPSHGTRPVLFSSRSSLVYRGAERGKGTVLGWTGAWRSRRGLRDGL
ncbi:unnamed protein product [Boreogadus saida]